MITLPVPSIVVMGASIVCMFVSLGMFFLVFWQAPQRQDNRLVAAYMATVFLWSLSAFLIRFSAMLNHNPDPFGYLIAAGIGLVAYVIFAIGMYYADLSTKIWARIILIVGLIYLVGLIPVSYIGRLYWDQMQVLPNGGISYEFKPFLLVNTGIYYTMVIVSLTLLWRTRHQQARTLFLAGLAIFGGMVTSLFPILTQYAIPILLATASVILMAHAILRTNLFNPLAQLNRELVDTNDRLSGMTYELRVANEELVEASRLKSVFLANMSHELRTPLNSIIGYTEMLTQGMYGELNEKQSDRLSRVMRNGQQLLQLINDILDLSKIESNRLELNIGSVEIAPLIAECLTAFEPLASNRGLTLASELREENLPTVLGDSGRILQVLMNLVSNAVKFTPEGTVTIRARPMGMMEASTLPIKIEAGGPWMLLEVADTGIGIAPEHQSVIFDEFRQVDDSTSRMYEGTGLGLAITRQLVHLMDGHIWVTSTPAAGSTFSFLLPIEATVHSVEHIRSAETTA